MLSSQQSIMPSRSTLSSYNFTRTYSRPTCPEPNAETSKIKRLHCRDLFLFAFEQSFLCSWYWFLEYPTAHSLDLMVIQLYSYSLNINQVLEHGIKEGFFGWGRKRQLLNIYSQWLCEGVVRQTYANMVILTIIKPCWYAPGIIFTMFAILV